MKLSESQRASQEQFSRQSKNYGVKHILADISDVAAATKFISLRETGDVLDVATGRGHTGLYFAGLGHRVTLADLSQAMLDQAKNMASERGLSVETCLSPAENLPFEDASFDLVTCRVAAHHFGSPADFVRESSRVLRDGGWLLVIDGSVEDGNPVAEEWIHQVEKFRDPSHGRFLTPNAWTRLCHEAGLKVQQCELTPFKQPDLNWYFETAATSPENRAQVLELIENAPPEAKELFQLGEENGKIVWWWRRLTLIAQK